MSVVIEGLTKSFGGPSVVTDLSCEFRSGAISVLLGASGCGKTTTLRCIAGLEEPDGGLVRIEGETVFSSHAGVNLPPEERRLGMVFQSYAIWPHMTVHENVALPLHAQKFPRAGIKDRVAQTLSLLGLADFEHRGATQLSGGQQQRVAIARCLVTQPRLILLDEPLSNLDAKLRLVMRSELRDLQRRTKATMVFVTHDQEEAMSLADEVFLFNQGRILQHGSPANLYTQPANRYVAEFLGQANLIDANLVVLGEKRWLQVGNTQLAQGVDPRSIANGERCLGMIRPEAWQLGTAGSDGIPAQVTALSYLGDRMQIRMQTPAGIITVMRPGHESFQEGENFSLSVPGQLVTLFPTVETLNL